MNILIVGNRKEGDRPVINQVISTLEGHAIYLDSGFFEWCEGRGKLYDGEPLDYAISIGGDGTVLKVLARFLGTSTAVIGINTGRLGFLTSFGKDEIEKKLPQAIEGLATVEDLPSLRVEIPDLQLVDYGVNDLSVVKTDISSMISVTVGGGIAEYKGDGVVISIPAGSTAYNLSCGGPIMMPGIDAIAITPVAPHMLTMRPLIAPLGRYEITAQSRSGNVMVSVDSRTHIVPNGSKIIVERSGKMVKRVVFPENNFIASLKSKFMWSVDTRE